MLTFGVLGPLVVRRDGVEVGVAGPRLRTLLAVLLVNPGRVVPVDELGRAIWPRTQPTNAEHTVRTYLSRLRRAVGADDERPVVVSRAPGYVLDVDPERVDAVRFERLAAAGRAALARGDPEDAVAFLRAALELWRGDAYEEFPAPTALRLEADRLAELRRSTVEDRVEADLGVGGGVELAPEIEKALAEDPHRERMWGQLMIALYRGGRQADALAAYRRARSALIDGLGVEPATALQELFTRVLAHDPGLLVVPAASPHVPAPRPPTRRRRRRSRRVLPAAAGCAVLGSAAVLTLLPADSGSRSASTSLAPNSVAAVAADGTVSRTVAVGTNPTALVAAGGLLWVANRSDGTVSVIDPRTASVVQTVSVGQGPDALVATGGDVWVANTTAGTVTRVNVAARTVVDTITVGMQPAALAAGNGGVWVANSGDNTVVRVDARTGALDRPIDVGDGPDGLAVRGGELWVANGRDRTVSRIDTVSREAVSGPVTVGSGPKGVLVAAGSVWVADQLSGSVTRIDPESGRTGRTGTRRIDVGDGPDALAEIGGTVWVSNRFDATLSRIDARSGHVTTLPIPSSPRGLAVSGGRLWVAVGADASAAHRGGTLTVATTLVPGDTQGVDPALEYLIPTFGPQRIVYDSLVGLRVTEDSRVLVPDLAEDIPVPGDGGRTYTFTVRAGIRYATGALVQPADFVRGLKRALVSQGGRPDFYAGVLGAQGCIATHRDCDLSRGVTVDAGTRRLTFHLAAADPDFLFKLMTFVFPAPPGTPLGTLPGVLPGTGPYRIAAFARGTVYRLERNRFFRQWSYAAQPNGYPDVITWVKVASPQAGTAAVEAGRADVAFVTALGNRAAARPLVEDLRRRLPAQLHHDAFWGSTDILLDNRRPPFDNALARQAVNYAVDRRVLADLFGGPDLASPLCQLFPPGFPGHSWYCPYTSGPADGTYHGPDLVRARDLVRASGTAGDTVHVWGVRIPYVPPYDDYLVQVLTRLGYRVVHHVLDAAHADAIERVKPQVVSSGWAADFPAPANYYGGVLECTPSSIGFCDEDLDARAARAAALQLTDPGAALREWAALDRASSDLAAAVPGVSTSDWRLTSSRVGNYQSSPLFGPALSQLWVR